MTEDYFLYFEEIDWACRARGKFGLAYAHDSLVYHKEGGSIGSSSTSSQSMLAIHYLYRNRVRFIRRFYRARLARNLRQIAFEMLVMAKRRQFRAIGVATRAVMGELWRGAPAVTVPTR
jgi:GT2 family glycosyltransferase